MVARKRGVGEEMILFWKHFQSDIFAVFCQAMVRKRWKDVCSLKFFWVLTDWTLITIFSQRTAEPLQEKKKKKCDSLRYNHYANDYINLKSFGNIKRFIIEFLIKPFVKWNRAGNYENESYTWKCWKLYF